jgi:hypothetical protein
VTTVTSDNKIGLTLEQSKGQKIPIRYVGEFLSQMQLTIFHIGDFLAGGDFRTRGHSVDFVKNRCELVFEKVSEGSFQASLALSDVQTTLGGQLSLGQETLQEFYYLVEQIDNEDEIESKISKTISEPLHRTRIVDDFIRLWPSEQDSYRVQIKYGPKERSLKPSKKLLLEGLLSHYTEQQVTEIRGVLGTFSVIPTKIIKIVGPDGNITCTFTDEKKETAKKFIERPLIAKGEAIFDAAGRVKELINVFHIEPFTNITIRRIFSDHEELQLKQPITVAIDYRDDYWVMEYEDLGIIATAPDYNECLTEFHKEFFFLWKEYGLATNSDLTKGAKKLKERILSTIQEPPHL